MNIKIGNTIETITIDGKSIGDLPAHLRERLIKLLLKVSEGTANAIFIDDDKIANVRSFIIMDDVVVDILGRLNLPKRLQAEFKKVVELTQWYFRSKWIPLQPGIELTEGPVYCEFCGQIQFPYFSENCQNRDCPSQHTWKNWKKSLGYRASSTILRPFLR